MELKPLHFPVPLISTIILAAGTGMKRKRVEDAVLAEAEAASVQVLAYPSPVVGTEAGAVHTPRIHQYYHILPLTLVVIMVALLKRLAALPVLAEDGII